MKFKVLISFPLALLMLLISGNPASATPNTLNSFTPAGTSWVNVPDADKVYFHDLGDNWDDKAITYLESGESCSDGTNTVNGPALLPVSSNRNGTDMQVKGGDYTCVASDSTPITSMKKVPFGFGHTINFFGQQIESGYPNTNGGLFISNPSNAYDQTIFKLVRSSESTAILPMAYDQYFLSGTSNIWFAQTMISGHKAVVFSWEKMNDCCSSEANDVDKGSFQLVLIDRSDLVTGDFDAWFNYDELSTTQGYSSPDSYVDLHSAVSNSTNVVTLRTGTGFATTCEQMDPTYYNNPEQERNSTPNPQWIQDMMNNSPYGKLVATGSSDMELYSDQSCTIPIQPVVGEIGTYLRLRPNSTNVHALGVGWGSYDATTGKTSSNEFFPNINRVDLFDNGATPMKSVKINTDVPGRIAVGQRGGATVGDPQGNGVGEPDPTTSPTTGLNDALASEVEDLKLVLDVSIGARLGGSSSSVSGSGLAPNTDYELIMRSAPQVIYTGKSDGNGNFIQKISIPESACGDAGKHTLSLVGQKTNGDQVKAVAYLVLDKKCNVLALIQGGKIKKASFAGVRFGYDSDKLTKKSKANLKVIASLLVDAKTLDVVGYTQTDRKSKTAKVANKDLAKSRAIAVKKYLAKLGVAKANVVIIAKGSKDPVSKKQQKLNRRVEIMVRYFGATS